MTKAKFEELYDLVEWLDVRDEGKKAELLEEFIYKFEELEEELEQLEAEKEERSGGMMTWK